MTGTAATVLHPASVDFILGHTFHCKKRKRQEKKLAQAAAAIM
jgi:hypothetical protein